MKLAAWIIVFGLAACETEEAQAPKNYPTNPAVYVEMPDGVRIAVDIHLPEGLTSIDTIPALVNFTRYWRAQSFDPPSTEKSEVFDGINRAGYAIVLVDTRGSGASFGSREAEFSTCETADFKHVIDWIAGQSWSNGRVATIGVSYPGNTAEHAGFDPSPALKATVPRFTDYDAYRSILFPGGLTNLLITSDWAAGVKSLDLNEVPAKLAAQDGPRLLGVKPVDADVDGRQLASAVAGHVSNIDVNVAYSDAVYRDDLGLADKLTDACGKSITPYQFKAQVEKYAIPSFHWGSWMDAGTAAGVLARFASYDAPARYVIGAWTHGAGNDADPFNPIDTAVAPSVEEQYGMIFEFLAPYLMEDVGDDQPAPLNPVLDYYTMGQGQWKQTTQWPPEGVRMRKLYLAPSNHLDWSAPVAASEPDTYTVDFAAGTGQYTRWSTQLGGTEVFYGDRRDADALLLTYTSPTLDQPMELTGTAVLELYTTSSHDDGAVIVYLEAVAPDGAVTMITEGELRLIHRQVAAPEPPYPRFGPYHSFARAQGSPMPVNQVELITFALMPTSVEIPAGYAIRIAIAGHDKDSFARFPKTGTPSLHVHHDPQYPSSIHLPISYLTEDPLAEEL